MRTKLNLGMKLTEADASRNKAKIEWEQAKDAYELEKIMEFERIEKKGVNEKTCSRLVSKARLTPGTPLNKLWRKYREASALFCNERDRAAGLKRLYYDSDELGQGG